MEHNVRRPNAAVHQEEDLCLTLQSSSAAPKAGAASSTRVCVCLYACPCTQAHASLTRSVIFSPKMPGRNIDRLQMNHPLLCYCGKIHSTERPVSWQDVRVVCGISSHTHAARVDKAPLPAAFLVKGNLCSLPSSEPAAQVSPELTKSLFPMLQTALKCTFEGGVEVGFV